MPKKKAPLKGLPSRVRNPPALQQCRVVVLGLNALGYRIAQILAATDVASLLLIDHRIVTKSAQRRDGYDAIDIGRPKIHAAVQRCHELNSRMEIIGISSRRPKVPPDTDVIIDCEALTKQRHRHSSIMLPLIQIRAAQSSAWLMQIRCIEALGRSSRRPITYTNMSAESCIVAGLAVFELIQHLRGHIRHAKHRVNMGGLSIEIKVR